jgi:hypothetical protein
MMAPIMLIYLGSSDVSLNTREVMIRLGSDFVDEMRMDYLKRKNDNFLFMLFIFVRGLIFLLLTYMVGIL